jgi:hypothetical protein
LAGVTRASHSAHFELLDVGAAKAWPAMGTEKSAPVVWMKWRLVSIFRSSKIRFSIKHSLKLYANAEHDPMHLFGMSAELADHKPPSFA